MWAVSPLVVVVSAVVPLRGLLEVSLIVLVLPAPWVVILRLLVEVEAQRLDLTVVLRQP